MTGEGRISAGIYGVVREDSLNISKLNLEVAMHHLITSLKPDRLASNKGNQIHANGRIKVVS